MSNQVAMTALPLRPCLFQLADLLPHKFIQECVYYYFWVKLCTSYTLVSELRLHSDTESAKDCLFQPRSLSVLGTG